MKLENLNLVELNTLETTEIYGGCLFEFACEVVRFITEIIKDALK
jgi:hypothetical protein